MSAEGTTFHTQTKPRSTMSSILAVGVGVAAAAFLVRPGIPSHISNSINPSHRAELDYWRCEDQEEKQLVHWAKRFTKGASSPR